MRDLQAGDFPPSWRQSPGACGTAAPEPSPTPAVEAAPPQQTVDLNPLMRRIDEIEDEHRSPHRADGRIRAIRSTSFSQRADRMQKQMDLPATQQSNAGARSACRQAEPPAGSDTLASVCSAAPPAPGILGQIPADHAAADSPHRSAAAPLRRPPIRSVSSIAAMSLLSRAQYQRGQSRVPQLCRRASRR